MDQYIYVLKLLDRLGCKSNERTHFLLGKNIARSLYRIHDAVQRRRGYAGVVAARCSGCCRVAGDVRSTTAWRRGGGLPVASVPRVDRVATRVFGGVTEQRRTSCRAMNATFLFYMALRDGGPPAVLGWASPIRTRVKGPVGRWANWWRSIQHSPP